MAFMNRRDSLRKAATATATALTGVRLKALTRLPGANSEAEKTAVLRFPDRFLFGAATSSVQIEGASKEDGKGESIWDRFARVPGNIRDGSTPDVACDSYHRWPEDVDLLKRMKLQSFRFSISWPRIFPAGHGAINQKGLDHYSRLVDALLAANIQPLITAFHWDLPQALEEAGGWPNRDTASHFADYAGLLAKTYGDRAQRWCLLNEPQAFTVAGYGWGVHAPGKKDRGLMLRATHCANLAQGLGFRAMKAQNTKLQLGIAHDFDLGQPLTDSDVDRAAWKRFDAFRNLWFIEPAFTGKYPEAFEGGVPAEAMGLKPGDEVILKVPLDYSGVNYYCGREYFAAGEKQNLLHGLDSHAENAKERFYPQGMPEVLLRMTRQYPRPIEITETGWEGKDVPDAEGRVRDPERIHYLRTALTGVHQAMAEGADVRSLHVWSLLDDWESGFAPRIGLTYVEHNNHQKRILKDYGIWYGEVARTRKIGA